MVDRVRASRGLAWGLFLVVGLSVDTWAGETDERSLDVRAALEAAVETADPLQGVDSGRLIWMDKMDSARGKISRGKTAMILSTAAGVGLMILAQIPSEESDGNLLMHFAGLGVWGGGMYYGYSQYRTGKNDLAAAEAEGRAKGYLSFYEPKRLQVAVGFRF